MGFLMKFFGWWWKGVSRCDLPTGGIEIERDPKAWSKWIFIFWRFQQRWAVFEVETDKPYFVFFTDKSGQMMYRKQIKKKYFAARIGTST